MPATTTERLQALKDRAAEADRQRASAETLLQQIEKRKQEIDTQIQALGIEPDKAEAELAKLDKELAKELTAIEQALQAELDAYKVILVNAK